MDPHPIFRPHGDYAAQIDGAMLIVTVSGSWNIEMHQESNRLAQPYVEQLEKQGPWGCIVVVTDTLVSSLEVFRAGRKAVEDARGASRLKALAWVIAPDVEGYTLFLPHYRHLYAGLLDSDIFGTLDEARRWMKPRLGVSVE